FLLGRPGSGPHALQRAARAGIQPRPVLDAPRGDVARGNQLRILAGQRNGRRAGVLRVCATGAVWLAGHRGPTDERVLQPRARRFHPAVGIGSVARVTRRHRARLLPERVRRGRRSGALGSSCPRSAAGGMVVSEAGAEMTARAMSRPSVVIIGGGFGGLYAAKRLSGEAVDVTLVDRK